MLIRQANFLNIIGFFLMENVNKDMRKVIIL